MRADLTAAERTLLESGKYAEHWRVQVENGSGTMIDISDRLSAGSVHLPSPDAPIGTCELEFVREPNDDASGSLAPLVDASSFNREDDGLTINPLIQIGRDVTLEIAITARGAARPADGSSAWHEVLGGYVKQPHWPERYGNVRVECLDRAYALMRTYAEEERTYSAGTTIEAAIQAVLDDTMGASAYTLTVDDVAGSGATGQGLSVNFEAGIKPVWDIAQALAHSIGWVLWYRYDATGTAQLTLTEPRRSKSAADYTFTTSQIEDVTKLTVVEEDIRNVVVVSYFDSQLDAQRVDAEDATSIAKYGDIRRLIVIAEEEDSPIRTQADAEALRDAVLSDLKDPDADQAIRTFGAWWAGDPSVDLYSFAANTYLYDNAQTLAPYRIDIEFAVGEMAAATIAARGKPSGGSGQWLGRVGPARSDVPAITDLYTSEQTESAVTKTWTVNAACSEVWVYQATAAQDTADPWPDADTDVPAIYATDTTTSLSITLPDANQVTYLILEPRDAALQPGEQWRVEVHPIDPEPPVWEEDDDETATTGTRWVKVTERGLAVAAVRMAGQTGRGTAGTLGAPTRGPGDASVVKGGTLGSGEYEHDVELAAARMSWIWGEIEDETGGVQSISPLAFDRGPTPTFISVLVEGQKIHVTADSDTESLKVEVTDGGTWSKEVDSESHTFDLSLVDPDGNAGIATGETWLVTVTARSDPAASVDGDTLTETVERTVDGDGGGAGSQTWEVVDLSAPLMGGDDITIKLKASAGAGTETLKVTARWRAQFGSWNDLGDVTGDLTPAVSAPPTTTTSYALDTTNPSSGASGTQVEYEITAQILDADAVIDSQTESVKWNVSGGIS